MTGLFRDLKTSLSCRPLTGFPTGQVMGRGASYMIPGENVLSHLICSNRVQVFCPSLDIYSLVGQGTAELVLNELYSWNIGSCPSHQELFQSG